MRLCEFSVIFQYVVAVDDSAVMIYAPKSSDVVQRVISHWIMSAKGKMILYISNATQASCLADSNIVLRAIDAVNARCYGVL